MPSYSIESGPDGRPSRVLRDGLPLDEAVRLERPFDLVNIYFRTARGNLGAMREAPEPELRRAYGLQSFVMGLTGVEAFTNVYFHLLAEERARPDVRERGEGRDSLLRRLDELIRMAFGGPIEGHDLILGRIRDLYRLRNDTMHPRFDPSSLSLFGPAPVFIHGMTVSFQAVFDDHDFCMSAHLWCMLLVVRIAKAAGAQDLSAFCFHWTGAAPGLSEEWLLERLGLPANH